MPTKKLRGQPPTMASGNVEGVYAGSQLDKEDNELAPVYEGKGIGGGTNQEGKVYSGSKVKSKRSKAKHVVKTQNAGY